MVILDVQLWELGTQRLHQGLSETILVNTQTDVREFKKKTSMVRYYCFSIIGYINLGHMLFFSDIFNGFSYLALAWYSTLILG